LAQGQDQPRSTTSCGNPSISAHRPLADMPVVSRGLAAFLRAAAVLRLARAAEAPPPEKGTAALPEARPKEHSTTNRLSWKPTCKDLLAYAADNPAHKTSAGIRKIGPYACAKHTRAGSVELDTGAVNSRATQRPIDFLHVSKSAGTFFCACGEAAGRNAGVPGAGDLTNCHRLHEDQVYWESGPPTPAWARKLPVKSSCASQASQMQSRGIDLEGNENFLPGDGVLCPEFENVVLVRDPIHRLISHLVFMEFDPRNMTAEDILTQFPRLSNNYFARVLGGEPVQGLPRGQLPPRLESSRRKLREFDDVFVVDKHLTARIEGRFGWHCSGVDNRTSEQPGGTAAVVAELQRSWPPGDWDALLAANAVDIELFKEAQIINAAQSLLKQVGISEDSS